MSSRHLTVPVALLAVCLTGCETRPITDLAPIQPQFITYGAVDVNNTYSNVGAFIVKSPTTGAIFPICSGTLISPTVFLTAAHCTEAYLRELAPLGWQVFASFSSPIGFGTLTSNQTVLVQVTAVISNPLFNQAQDDPGDLGTMGSGSGPLFPSFGTLCLALRFHG